MDEVSDGLFVGTVEDAGDNALIREHSIATIVSLTHRDPDGGFPSDATIENVLWKDRYQTEYIVLIKSSASSIHTE